MSSGFDQFRHEPYPREYLNTQGNSETLYTYILVKTSFASVINMKVIFLFVEKNETKIHLEQPFYLLTKT